MGLGRVEKGRVGEGMGWGRVGVGGVCLGRVPLVQL